jgi:hypothetical protein
MGSKAFNGKALRNYSILATQHEIRSLTRLDIAPARLWEKEQHRFRMVL